jgi:hypothetical protein
MSVPNRPGAPVVLPTLHQTAPIGSQVDSCSLRQAAVPAALCVQHVLRRCNCLRQRRDCTQLNHALSEVLRAISFPTCVYIQCWTQQASKWQRTLQRTDLYSQADLHSPSTGQLCRHALDIASGLLCARLSAITA